MRPTPTVTAVRTMVARASSSTVVSVVVAKAASVMTPAAGTAPRIQTSNGARADARHLMAPGRNLLEDDRGGAAEQALRVEVREGGRGDPARTMVIATSKA